MNKMFAFIKNMFIKKNELTPQEMVTLGYFEDIKGTYESLSDRINADTMDIISVKCFFKHIPIRGKNAGWTDEIYNLADKCHIMLYNYCKKKHYIHSDASYNDYLNGILFKE